MTNSATASETAREEEAERGGTVQWGQGHGKGGSSALVQHREDADGGSRRNSAGASAARRTIAAAAPPSARFPAGHLDTARRNPSGHRSLFDAEKPAVDGGLLIGTRMARDYPDTRVRRGDRDNDVVVDDDDLSSHRENLDGDLGADDRQLREYTGRVAGKSVGPNGKKKNGMETAWGSFQELRSLCGRLVNHDRTQMVIVTLIAINALMMGIGTFPFVTQDPTVKNAFDLTDTIFLVIFTVELGMQFVYRGYTLLLDGWLVFDLIVIVLSWCFDSVQVIRAFRIFRALRLITRVKVMKNLVLGTSD
jgi:hypothetical protein